MGREGYRRFRTRPRIVELHNAEKTRIAILSVQKSEDEVTFIFRLNKPTAHEDLREAIGLVPGRSNFVLPVLRRMGWVHIGRSANVFPRVVQLEPLEYDLDPPELGRYWKLTISKKTRRVRKRNVN
jgi:hypothetical protein